MQCEQELCVYQCDGKCQLETIRIDRLGQCSECIYADIDGEYLKKIKQDFLKKQDELCIP